MPIYLLLVAAIYYLTVVSFFAAGLSPSPSLLVMIFLLTVNFCSGVLVLAG